MNLLGIRQTRDLWHHPGCRIRSNKEYAQKKGIDLEIFYTNSEGECIDRIIKAYL